VKRSFLLEIRRVGFLAAATALVAACYGLVRLAYGLFIPDVQAELSIGPTAAGLISSGSSIVYCVGAVIGFLLASRHPRGLVAAAGLTAGLGAAGMAAAPGAVAFAAAAVLASAGAGLVSPALVTVIGRNVSARAEPGSQTVVNSGTGPGLVAAGVLALALLPDWRLAWALVSVFAGVAAAVTLVLDRGGDDRTSRHGDGAGPTAADRRVTPLSSGRPGIPPATWFGAHRVVIVAALLLGAGSAAVWTFGRTLLLDAGASEPTSVALWVALGAGGTAAILTARRLGAVLPRTAWAVTTTAAAVATAALPLAAAADGPARDIAALLACGVFGWGYVAATGALIARTTALDPARASAGTALLFVLLILGQALGAAVLGIFAAGSGQPTVFFAAAPATFAAAAIPLLTRRRIGCGMRFPRRKESI
jgi:predicted MFS family arabinose efflux permease